ncbi:MAG: hypothetical protein KF812_01155 [Fimbriimonadaceae bacterium]|nr:hypothetical protein [Fimbriimonadaceae bacterium]
MARKKQDEVSPAEEVTTSTTPSRRRVTKKSSALETPTSKKVSAKAEPKLSEAKPASKAKQTAKTVKKAEPVVEEPATPIVKKTRTKSASAKIKETTTESKPKSPRTKKTVSTSGPEEAATKPKSTRTKRAAQAEEVVAAAEPEKEKATPRSRRSSKATKSEPKTEPVLEPKELPKPERSPRRAKRRDREQEPTVALEAELPPLGEVREDFVLSIELRDGEAALPIPTWRAVSASPRPQVADDDKDTDSESVTRRRRGRRRRGDNLESRVTAADAFVEPEKSEIESVQEKSERRGRRSRTQEAPDMESAADDLPRVTRRAKREELPKPLPPVVTREAVVIPPDAPQIVVQDGISRISIGHKALVPLFFFASALDESRLETVLEEIRLASEHGVEVVSLFVELEVNHDVNDDAVGFAAYLAQKVEEVAPQMRMIFRTAFVAPENWQKQYPNAVFVPLDGVVSEPSFCDDAYWSVAEECLVRFVRRVRLLPQADRIVGIHLERGEWFHSEEVGYDSSVAAHEKFRGWLRARYRNDVVSLRASWFDGQVQFDTVAIPEDQVSNREGESFVRTDRKSRRWVDYHLFLSDAIAERINKLANATKVASEGTFLVGASYGYTFEWSHPASGHLSLGKLLRSPDLDYIAGPPSYASREPGAAAAFPGPVDSFSLNNKLAISEEDYKTPISGRNEPDTYNPVMKTPQALESVHWRGAGGALAHGTGTVWMDTWGNGWLNSRGIWERAQEVRRGMTMRLAAPQTAPDVALLIDERSLAYLVDRDAFNALVKDVRQSLVRSGLSVGTYLLSDLAHRESFPESKLYVFVNAWDMRPEVRSAVKTRLQRDGKVLFWLYVAALFEGGRESLERAREVTGIALRPQPFASKSGTTLLNSRDPLSNALPERELAQGGMLAPSYFAIPEVGTVLGEYSQTGLPSFVVCPFDQDPNPQEHWTSVFLGEPIVTPALFRELGRIAGCHIWSFDDDVLTVRPPFLTIHTKTAGPRTLALPDNWCAYDLINGEWMAMDNKSLRFNALAGATYSFLVGTRGSIDALLGTDPIKALDVPEIERPHDDQMHWDALQLDVPIMQLGEWVESSWSDDLAEDLLLKPSLLDIERRQEEATIQSEEQRPGRKRRRKTRRRGGEEGTDRRTEGVERVSANDDSINVVFRKRD